MRIILHLKECHNTSSCLSLQQIFITSPSGGVTQTTKCDRIEMLMQAYEKKKIEYGTYYKIVHHAVEENTKQRLLDPVYES